MSKRDVLLVLPKLSSYQYKDDAIKVYLQELICKQIDFAKKYGLSISCFAEDMLALALFEQMEEIKWHTLVGDSDRYFLKTSVDEIPQRYWEIEKQNTYEALIKKAIQQHKAPNPKSFADTITFKNARLRTLYNKIRQVASDAMSMQKFVIYINASNNYASRPEPFMGDGVFYCIVDAIRDISQFYFGGIPIKESDSKIVIEGLVGRIC